jgi:hypothetical protein
MTTNFIPRPPARPLKQILFTKPTKTYKMVFSGEPLGKLAVFTPARALREEPLPQSAPGIGAKTPQSRARAGKKTGQSRAQGAGKDLPKAAAPRAFTQSLDFRGFKDPPAGGAQRRI